MRTGRALRQFPFVAEQVPEEVVAPLRWRGGPNDLQAAGDRVIAFAGAEAALPAEALLLDAGGFGLRPHMGRIGPAPWVLPNAWPPAMSATVSSSFIAMRAKISRISLAASERIRVAVRAFRVDVDQAHLHGREGIFEVPVTGVAGLSLVASHSLSAPQ